MTGSKRRKIGPKVATARKGSERSDPKLALLLARQTIARWQFAAPQLRARAVSAASEESNLIEINLGLAQLQAMADRLRPLLKSRDMARRFESEELLVQLDALSTELLARRALQPNPLGAPPPRSAAEVEERLRATFGLKAAE